VRLFLGTTVFAGRAVAFVTGDKALLELSGMENVPILSPRQLWQKLAGLENPGARTAESQ
jgi:predicted nucleic acid-binding protein